MSKNNFFDKVYFVVKQIPFGRVSTYGSIARYIGSPGSSRMVGWAMNASHSRENIPAHRVVNRYGFLTGKHHFQGTNLMQDLLESEGIKIINNQILNFNIFFWDPSDNLEAYKN
jgi:methylated-DNA-protein-cysteine methyltransferase-like protein